MKFYIYTGLESPNATTHMLAIRSARGYENIVIVKGERELFELAHDGIIECLILAQISEKQMDVISKSIEIIQSSVIIMKILELENK